MNSNAQPEHEICPHDGHLLDRTGKCWYCGGIYPAGKPALTVVESEPQVEVESVQTMTVDLETGEIGRQLLLGIEVPVVEVQRRGNKLMTPAEFNGARWELGEGDRLTATRKGDYVAVKIVKAWEASDD